MLDLTGISAEARYVVPHRYDERSGTASIIDEARHPQTLIAWGMNGGDLPVPFGGPLRMRVPRQLGYKSVKSINR